MSLSVESLARIAIELQSGISHQDRFQRLINTLRQLLGCDASALLRYEQRLFRPLAIDGLAPDVLGRRFSLDAHPRLEADRQPLPPDHRAPQPQYGDLGRLPPAWPPRPRH